MVYLWYTVLTNVDMQILQSEKSVLNMGYIYHKKPIYLIISYRHRLFMTIVTLSLSFSFSFSFSLFVLNYIYLMNKILV